MTSHKSVSFIIPFFNAEKTIRRALSSVLSAGLTDYEVLCINDGSTDRSPEVVEQMAASHRAIRIIRLERNLGVSSARNVGMASATGDFIAFVDSDDELGPSFGGMLDGGRDLVFGGHTLVLGAATRPSFDHGAQGHLGRPGIELLVRDYLSRPVGNSIVVYCWGKLYRRKFLEKFGLKFDTELSIYEDLKFVSSCLLHAHDLFIHPGCTYYKNLLPGGLSEKIFDSPLGYQDSLKVLSKAANTSEERAQNLFRSANTYFIGRTLFLAKDFPLRRLRKLIGDIQSELLSMKGNKISNWVISRLIQWKIFRVPILMEAFLRFYGLIHNAFR